MSTTVITDLQQLEQILKQDLLQTAGTPVLTFLQSMQTIAAKLASIAQPSAADIAVAQANSAAAWVVLQAGILGSLPNLGAQLVLALIEFAQSKVQAFLAAPAAAAK